jgi:photosystem II stability/assembly factor-like uncharacterized protein
MGSSQLSELLEEQDAVYAVAVAPDFAASGLCFAARTSGLYRSRDGGASWESAYATLNPQAELVTSAVAVSPHFAHDQLVLAGGSGGILRSDDGGESWRAILLPTPAPLVTCLAFSPHFAADRTAFAATMQDGVYRSVDAGATWVRWNFGLFDLRVLALAVAADYPTSETLFAGTETGLYISRNGGRSWQPTAFGEELVPVLSLALAPDSGRGGRVWAGTESAGLWLSADRGRTWARRGAELFGESVNALLAGHEDPGAPAILALATEGLFISRDGGATWHAHPETQATAVELTAVAAPAGLGSGALLFVGTDTGAVWRLRA